MEQMRFMHQDNCGYLMDKHTEDPGACSKPLARELEQAGTPGTESVSVRNRADQSPVTRDGSQRLEGQGVQAGDGNVQRNQFGGIYVKAGHDAIVAGRDVSIQQVIPPARAIPAQIVVGNVPQAPAAFQPREGLLSRLRAARPGISVVKALTGMRGVGKTQIAAAYARECINAGWRLVAWIDAETMPQALADLARAADALGIETGEVSVEEVGKQVRGRLEADGDRCLVVFDNVTDATALRPYIPAAGKVHVVLTSTNEGAANLGEFVEVNVFAEDEALSFLAGRTLRYHAEAARELASELGYLPLALAQAAAVISRQRLTYHTYLSRLRSFSLDKYLTPADGEPYPRGLAEAILLSVDAIEATDRAGLCRPVLGVIALLSSAGVPRDLLYTAGREGILSRVAEPSAIDRALGHLAGASLLTFSGDGSTVAAHRLVMRVAREQRAHNGTLTEAGVSASRLLLAVSTGMTRPAESRPIARSLIPQIFALTAHLMPPPADGELENDLLDLRVWALWCMNELREAIPQAVEYGESVVADCGRLLGDDHPQTLHGRNNLGRAYTAAGRLTDAISLYEPTLADRERVLGADHPDTLASRNNLAFAYRAAGRLDEATTLYERTLADRERVLGTDHRDTLESRNNLGYAYRATGRLDEAIVLYERVLADRERLLGTGHPGTLLSRNNLAAAYRAAGRVAEALAMYERTLADRERELGDEHPSTLTSRHNLAVAYQAGGRLAEAIALLERVVAGRERVLGIDHPATSRSRVKLVNVRQRARDAGSPAKPTRLS
jgi:tetratricopeptide (TPR) repeat protein